MKKVGEVLSEYREKLNIPLEKVAQITKIRTEFLEAIEANRFEELPAEPFVKGFLHSYAQFLGLDPETILALLRRDFKTGEKGKVVPRQFLRPLTRKRSWINPHVTVIASVSIVVSLVVAYAAIQVWRLQQPPMLVVSSPLQSAVLGRNVIVKGMTRSDAVVSVDSMPIAINPDGEFETSLFYPDNGTYSIIIQAEDRHKRVTMVQRTVTVKE